ncbi:YeeE/YedE family protein [Oceanisphaera sediminis]|uniref:YeeE/YedE family protein n=1 Tax=Oceanisphaera sediminis TaxID=981381 RepID=A0ABP7EK60_9GAMM
MLLLIALLSGGLFGLGLVVSGMVDPTKVQGFLNLFGDWDPSLALVMGGALAVFAPGYWLWRRTGRSQCALGTELPRVPAPLIDKRLVLGALLFGIGWGLAGICPGPALGLGASLQWQAGVFIAAMLAGFWLVGRFNKPS